MGAIERGLSALEGKFNDLIDTVANTPSAYKQRIRELGVALAELRANGDEAQGRVNGLLDTIGDLDKEKAEAQEGIDQIITDDDPSNDDAAVTLQTRIIDINERIESRQELLAGAQSELEKIRLMIDQLESHKRKMLDTLDDLEIAEAATKAMNNSANAAERAAAVGDKVGSVDVDSIKERIDRQKRTADARFERVFGDLQSQRAPEEAVKLSKAKQLLEERRRQIAEKAKEGVGEPVAAK
jgi:phage shock protein A